MKTFNKKKGFTIVELVIVIAVIGVLTAVLVPTFVNLVNKANNASDESLVKNLNTQLRMKEQTEGKNKTFTDALSDAKEAGYLVENLTPRGSRDIVWNQDKDEFGFGDEAKGEMYKYWKIYEKAADVPATQTYSIYAKGTKWTGDLVYTVGFDAGDNTNVSSITYHNESSNAQNVVIRTASFNTAVTVNAPLDEATHFGKAKMVDVIRVKKGTYEERGAIAGNINVAQGKVNLASGASVSNIVVSALSYTDSTGEEQVVAPDTEKTEVVVSGGSTINVVLVDESASSISLNDITQGDVTKVDYDENAAAIIGSQPFASLDDAIEAAEKGDTIVLLKDAAVTTKDAYFGTDNLGKACFAFDKSITLDGNDKTLTATGNGGGYVFYFMNTFENVKAKFVVKNLELVSTGIQSVVITNQWDAPLNDLIELTNVDVTCDGECVYANGFTSVVAEGSRFKQNGKYASGKDPVYYSAIIVGYAGTVTLRDCKVETFENGIATFPSGGTINLYNTRIEANAENENSFAFWSRIGNGTEWADSIINVFSGEYIGAFKLSDTSNQHDAFIHIYGGSFDHDPSAYVNQGAYNVTRQGSVWNVSEK